nr:MAG TPA: hypothetical protein [Caudoviricetes sp.]
MLLHDILTSNIMLLAAQAGPEVMPPSCPRGEDKT